MAHVILEEDLWDRDFVEARTEDFEAWRKAVEAATPEEAERVSGVPADEIRRAARLYARPHPNGSCLIWGMGVTQHSMGTDNARALVNLALLCGQVGKFGSGISPLRGQNNVQGCSDSGCLPNTFPGYEPLDGPANAKYSAAWGVELDPEPGEQSTHMIESMIEGSLTTMYVVGENPLVSDPYLAHAREAFSKLDFLVVQDIFMHETAETADVVLPAQSFAEKDGTFTNSERRVQLIRPIVDAPGEARADWEITNEIARRVLALLERPTEGYEHGSPSEIFDEMASLMPIITGLSHDRLDRDGGVQWPVPETGHPGSPRLFEDEFPRGRGLFVPVTQGAPSAELPSRRFPRRRDHAARARPRRDRSRRCCGHAPRRCGPAEPRRWPGRAARLAARRDRCRSACRRPHAAGRALRAVRAARRRRGELPHQRRARRPLRHSGVQGLCGTRRSRRHPLARRPRARPGCEAQNGAARAVAAASPPILSPSKGQAG